MAEEAKNERHFEPEALEAAKNFFYGDFSCEDGCSIKYRWFKATCSSYFISKTKSRKIIISWWQKLQL